MEIKIPHEVIIDTRMTYQQRIILMILMSECQMQKKDSIEISLKEFKSIYGIDKSRFRVGIEGLKKLGYVEQIKEINDKGTFYTSEYKLLKYANSI